MRRLWLSLALFLGLAGHLWDGQTRFTIITFSPHVTIKSFDPATNRGLVLTLPDNLEISAVAGRGEWMAGLIAKAGSLQWAADSIADTLGIAYIQVEGAGNWWNNLRWRLHEAEVEWRTVDLQETDLVTEFTTVDKVNALRLSGNWDNQAKTWFSDQQIASSQLGVGIVNSTSVPGLGVNASRVVESMGFKVRSLRTASQEVDQCVIRSRPAMKSAVTVRKLQNVFGCSWEASDEPDLQLILGQAYRSWKLGD